MPTTFYDCKLLALDLYHVNNVIRLVLCRLLIRTCLFTTAHLEERSLLRQELKYDI